MYAQSVQKLEANPSFKGISIGMPISSIVDKLTYERTVNGFTLYKTTSANLEDKGIKFISPSTACWRGYVASWLIEDDKLYLIDLKAYLLKEKFRNDGVCKNDCIEVRLDYLFPNQDKVFADWFSGLLRIPHGKLIRYVHMGYGSIYEKELYLRFVNGKYVSFREVDNKYLYKDKKTLAEKEMDGIWEGIFGVKRTNLPEKENWFKKLFHRL